MIMHMEAWFVVILVLVVLLCLKKIKSSQSIHLPPGPLYIPIISDILFLGTSFSTLKPLLCKLHAKHGPIFTYQFWFTPHIFIFDRFLAHKALIQNTAVFASRPKSLHNNQLNISNSSYGSTWRALRNNLASIMLHPSRIKSFSKTRTRVLDTLLDKLKFEAELLNNSVTLINHIQYAIFCLLVTMCFGENVDSDKIEEIQNIQQLLILSSGKYGSLNFFPKSVSRILFRNSWQELSQLRQNQYDLLVKLIQYRKRVIEKNSNDENVVCYVDTLLDLQIPDEKQKLDEREIVALCSEFLTAGTDTTSTAFEWIMANLVKYKHVQQMVVDEIDEVIGDREKREVREEDLEKLSYLKAVVLEGLRRHPPSHYAIPHTVTEDVILNGYLVPKNATVNFMVSEIGLDPTVWEDPLAFIPERFLKHEKRGIRLETFDISGKKYIKMMPFGAGRRIFPAYKLAMLHLEYFVANLVLNFEWNSLPTSDVDFSEKQEFTMRMKHSLQARISLRN